MTQQFKLLANAPPYVDWGREVQELISLLVEAVLTLPDSERRHVINEAVAPLFEALPTLKKVSGIGLIWMALLASGYPEYARRLSPLEGWQNRKTPAVAPGTPVTAAEIEESPHVA